MFHLPVHQQLKAQIQASEGMVSDEDQHFARAQLNPRSKIQLKTCGMTRRGLCTGYLLAI